MTNQEMTIYLLQGAHKYLGVTVDYLCNAICKVSMEFWDTPKHERDQAEQVEKEICAWISSQLDDHHTLNGYLRHKTGREHSAAELLDMRRRWIDWMVREVESNGCIPHNQRLDNLR